MTAELIAAVSRPDLNQPRTTWFSILAVISVAAPVFVCSKRGIEFERRVYWGSMVIAMACVFVAAYPYWKDGLGLAAFVAFIIVFRAYQATSYIKIGGKIRAFDAYYAAGPGNRQAARASAGRDSYAGFTTVSKTWWTLTVLAAAFALTGAMYFDGQVHPLAMAIGVGLAAVLAWWYGTQDALARRPVARRQLVQFVAVSVLTAGIFTVVYLATYALTRRSMRR
jgi:hypothetical protein